MIHIINRSNRKRYSRQLAQMHKLRHEIFVKRKGWTKLSSAIGMEIDRFDTKLATYYVKLDQEGNVLASIRSVPSKGFTMLSTLYKDICTVEAPPASEDNWELSRYFVSERKFVGDFGHPVKYELFVALIEHSLSNGIRELSGFMETFFMQRAAQLGWKIELLSGIHDYGEGEGVAMNLRIDEEMLAETRRRLSLHHKVIAGPQEMPQPTVGVTFEAEEVRALAHMLQNQPDSNGDLLNLIQSLGSSDAEEVRQAEGVLDRWIAHEELKAFGSKKTTALHGILSTVRH